MHYEKTNLVENPNLWALEPEVAPLPARWAIVFGLMLAVILVSVSSGTATLPTSDLEDWHGNVSASHSAQ